MLYLKKRSNSIGGIFSKIFKWVKIIFGVVLSLVVIGLVTWQIMINREVAKTIDAAADKVNIDIGRTRRLAETNGGRCGIRFVPSKNYYYIFELNTNPTIETIARNPVDNQVSYEVYFDLASNNKVAISSVNCNNKSLSYIMFTEAGFPCDKDGKLFRYNSYIELSDQYGNLRTVKVESYYFLKGQKNEKL